MTDDGPNNQKPQHDPRHADGEGARGAAGCAVGSEAHKAAILESLGEGICLAGQHGQLLWANQRFHSFDDATRQRVAAACRRAATRFGDAADGRQREDSARFDIASPDESRFYEVVVAPVAALTIDGQTPLAAVVWDVTASRRFQQKMDAIDRAGSELVRLNADSIRRMHVTERLKLLEQKIIKFLHELFNFDHFAIRLLDESTGKLELVMASGLSPEAMEVEMYAEREGNGIMGYVAATGRSYLCADVTTDRRYVVGVTGAKSSLTVPLRLHDRIIGAFNVESEQPAAFSEEDRQFAEMFATHMALAIHILDLLVVERAATGKSITGTVEGELSEPLADIVREADCLLRTLGSDPLLKQHLDRITADVDAIRRRVKEAASGPQNILGAEKAMLDLAIDPAMKDRRVLVADDEPRIRQIIRDVLGGRGCSVTICDNGATAIAALQKAAQTGEPPFQLVISDIKMPDRNGYEVFAEVKKCFPAAPVILMTGFGYDPHHSIVRASQEGLQCVLFKPFQIERLLEEVRKAWMLDTPTPAPPLAPPPVPPPVPPPAGASGPA